MTNQRNEILNSKSGNKQTKQTKGTHTTTDPIVDTMAKGIMAKETVSDRALFYKPLRGHHLLTFIACQYFEQVASIIQHHIPREAWEHIQLWETDPEKMGPEKIVQEKIDPEKIDPEKNAHQYWIQLNPPIRLNCQVLQGQAFVAQGIHYIAAEVMESGKVSALLNSQVPCLIWLAFGKLQSIQKSALVPVACHHLLSPLSVNPLPLWELPTIQETASTIHNQFHEGKETSQALALKNFKPNPASKAFLNAVAQGITMPKASATSDAHSVEKKAFRRRPQRSIGQWFALSMLGGIFSGSHLVRQLFRGGANTRPTNTQ